MYFLFLKIFFWFVVGAVLLAALGFGFLWFMGKMMSDRPV